MSDNREKTLVKNTTILSFGNLCTKGIMFIMTPLFTRWVSQSDYGVFDLLYTYLSLITPLITLDLKDAIFRFLANNENGFSQKEIISTGIVAHIMCLGLCILLAILISCFFPNERYVILFFCILIVSETLYTLFTNISRGIKRIPIFAIASILYILAMVISSIIFVKFLNGGLRGLLISYAIGYFASFIFMLFADHIKNFFSFKAVHLSVLKEMYRYALPMLPNAVGWWIINVSDRTIVSIMLGAEANAILAVTSKLPNLCQQIFGQFSYSWQESAVESVSSEDRDVFYNKVLNTIFKLMVSFIVILLGFEFLYFKYLYTEEYFLGYYLTPVLLIAVLVLVISHFFDGIYIALMKPKKSGGTTAIAAVINLLIDLLLIRSIGLWAAVISTLCSQLVLVFIRYFDLKKDINFRFDKKIVEYIFIVCYFTIGIYINNSVLNWLNLLLSILVFIILNLNYIKPIFDKIKNYIIRK